MAVSKLAKKYHDKVFPGEALQFQSTDPEFADFFTNFAFDEVINMPDLGGKEIDDRARFMAILAALLGVQGLEEFKSMLTGAFNVGVTPYDMKEIVYQGTAYLGIGRVAPFLTAVNEFLISKGVRLPLEDRSQTDSETRLEKGVQAQIDIFGDQMKDFWRSGPDESKHINRWLADNCFGDYYTRKGLTLAEREMLTFCYIAAQGGCDTQLTSHAAGNMQVGNDLLFLIKIISQILPYIGYPRSLNALACVNKAIEAMK